eukprot:CAMPEP_0185592814 /NCGR_PEP_ID=MMETSP0434-20130131/69300_1 /TAXON_ID=626734 ORGANISM="Favella taraikaensis, Strain Fe Narragansett Bay" /NCGR_SAMPLE_ID=MMETSP0434 /ASSEMBLY_ACC=CAM_ASM_000379 /LENGTH=61 /DNA_ID=CAMNT_0028218923 /DNA_START=471 /DNA_END=656 /DNA_ORIENTATION=-
MTPDKSDSGKQVFTEAQQVAPHSSLSEFLKQPERHLGPLKQDQEVYCDELGESKHNVSFCG